MSAIPEKIKKAIDQCQMHAVVVGVRKINITTATENAKNARAYLESAIAAEIIRPGVMRCARCKFELVRVTLAVNLGVAVAGNSKSEPCPNGCGPLWPVTWKEAAEDAERRLEAAFDQGVEAGKRAVIAERDAAVAERDALTQPGIPWWQIAKDHGCWTDKPDGDMGYVHFGSVEALRVFVTRITATAFEAGRQSALTGEQPEELKP